MANPKPRSVKTVNDIHVGDTFRQAYTVTDAEIGRAHV